MSREASYLAVALAVACVFGCVGRKLHPYELEPGHATAPGVESIALLPMNLVLALPGELDAASRRVEKRIARYLEDTGLAVSSVRLHEARSLLASIDAGDSRDDEAVASRFVERLHEERSFDIVVVPSLVYREARVRAVTHDVVWDGVTRKLEIVGENRRRLSLSYTGDFAGKMPAVSLHLLVYGALGEQIFESYAGLDLAHEVNLATPGQAITAQWLVKRQPLTDEDAIREGVALAFHPYLPMHSVEVGEAP